MKESRVGIALISILMLLALVAAIVASSTLFFQKRIAGSAYRDTQVQGRFAAQAGLSRALEELHDNGDWSPGTFAETIAPDIGFEVEVVNNRTGAGPIPAPDGSDVPPRHVWLQSTGIVRGQRVKGRFGHATAVQPLPTFNYAVHSTGGVPGAWRDCLVDSYDGIFANYVPYGTGGRPDRVAAHMRFDAGGTGNNISLDGNLLIPDNDLTCSITGPWSGALQVDASAHPPLIFRAPPALEGVAPGVCPSAGYIPPGRYGSLPFGTTAIQLGEGDYYFRDFDAYTRPEITLTGPGPTTVYVERGFHPGDRMNFGGDPEQLRIFFIDTGATCSFQPEINSISSCVVAGSTLRFSLTTNAEFYGAVICDIMPYTQTGSKIHYDESLKDVALEASTEWVLVNEGEE